MALTHPPTQANDRVNTNTNPLCPQTIVGTAIPRITDEFKGLGDVSWYAAAYFMTYGAAQPSAGKLYKYYDIKRTFLVSMLIFEVGSLLCGVAPN